MGRASLDSKPFILIRERGSSYPQRGTACGEESVEQLVSGANQITMAPIK